MWLLPLLALLLAPPARTEAQALQRHAFSHAQMGTQFNVVLYAPDSLQARRAAAAAFARLDTLNAHLSDYRSDSELSRLSATAGTGRAVPVSADLWTVLAAAQRVARQTEGAFDVTVGPLTRLWRRAMRRGTLPPSDTLRAARRAVGYQALQLDSTARTARLLLPGMRLDLGGIAKGFAVDEALAVLRRYGITAALVDGGGDLVVGAPPPGERGWRIAVSTPPEAGAPAQEIRRLAHRAIATSGDTYRYVEADDGTRYSHLLDPHTGLGLTHRRLVTVIASTGMQADALASAFSVLAPGAALRLADSMPGVAVRLLEQSADPPRLLQSTRFDALARK